MNKSTAEALREYWLKEGGFSNEDLFDKESLLEAYDEVKRLHEQAEMALEIISSLPESAKKLVCRAAITRLDWNAAVIDDDRVRLDVASRINQEANDLVGNDVYELASDADEMNAAVYRMTHTFDMLGATLLS